MRNSKIDQKAEKISSHEAICLNALLNRYKHDNLLPDGYTIYGINIKYEYTGVLLMIKAINEFGEKVIAFIGGTDVPGTAAKLSRSLRKDQVVWRVDKWEKAKFDDEEDE